MLACLTGPDSQHTLASPCALLVLEYASFPHAITYAAEIALL